MKLKRIVGLAVLAGVGLGCAHASHSGTSDLDDEETTSELRAHHRHHHRGGVNQFIAMSLDTLGEDDAQRPAIEKIHAELDACMVPTRDVAKQLTLTYADGIATGAIENATLEGVIVELNSTSAKAYECSTDALNQLHGLLTPAEREVVADKVQAHWEIWLQVNADAEKGGQEKGGRLAALAEDVDLSAEQLDQMSKALTVAFGRAHTWESKKAQAHVLAFAAAFVFEKFDARTVAPDENGRLSAHGARRMALFYETITPFLKAEQRSELAEQLREHANHPHIITSAN
ncbi:MAG: hypothetical protein Q8K32_29430 [Archangium sp.]|nr:hypothetical protein [Archangium sp.]